MADQAQAGVMHSRYASSKYAYRIIMRIFASMLAVIASAVTLQLAGGYPS